MDALIEKLDTKLRQWQPDVAEQVRQFVAEIIEMADQNTLDILRLRVVEQEVLDLLDCQQYYPLHPTQRPTQRDVVRKRVH